MKSHLMQSDEVFSHVKKILWYTGEGKFAGSPVLLNIKDSKTVSIFIHQFLSYQRYIRSTYFMT